jgi:anti-sigma-K factor RskA
MATERAQERAQQIRARIERIRRELADLETLSSGTVLKRMKTCGNPSCGCHQDSDKRHGPYCEWTHLKAGKYTHRSLSVEQAAAMKAAIANHRKLQKLVTARKAETEKLIETEHPRNA